MDLLLLTVAYQKWYHSLLTIAILHTMQTKVVRLDHLTDLTHMVTLD